MGRIIGIDYGEKRVGVAISDESGKVAFPKAVLPNDRMLMTSVKELIKGGGVSEVVVGESKNSQGADNEIMKKARAFALELARDTSVTIHFEPEHYSTQEVRAHTGEYLVDAGAAAVILNSFLAKRHGTPA